MHMCCYAARDHKDESYAAVFALFDGGMMAWSGIYENPVEWLCAIMLCYVYNNWSKGILTVSSIKISTLPPAPPSG